jgi:hypothetical protein
MQDHVRLGIIDFYTLLLSPADKYSVFRYEYISGSNVIALLVTFEKTESRTKSKKEAVLSE